MGNSDEATRKIAERERAKAQYRDVLDQAEKAKSRVEADARVALARQIAQRHGRRK